MKSVQQAGANKRFTAWAAAMAEAVLRPAGCALLLCGAASVGAEPVIQSAMAPVDISKLLQNPYAASAPVESHGFGRRLEMSLPLKPNFGVGQAASGEADWQAAAAQVLAAPSADGKPARPQTELGSGPEAARTRPYASAAGRPTRDSAQAGEFLLINDALRELRDSSELRDFKDFWREASAELNQFRGGLLFDEPSEEEMERRRSSPQRSELSNASGGFGNGGASADPGARQRSEAEIRRDSVLASAMLKKLIDELTPWVIGLVLTFALGRGAWGYWRLQKQAQRRRKSSGRQVRRRSATQL